MIFEIVIAIAFAIFVEKNLYVDTRPERTVANEVTGVFAKCYCAASDCVCEHNGCKWEAEFIAV